MPRAVAVLALSGALAFPATSGASDDPVQLAQAVKNEVVHVDPRSDGRLSPAEAGALRIQIAREALGRIKIVIVPPEAARRHGGVAPLANAIAQVGELRGALIVVAGSDVWLTTSYPSGAALAAVQKAMAGPYRKRIAADLEEAVAGVARADPGPSAEGGPGGAGGVTDDFGVGDFLDDVGNTLKIVLFGVGGVIAIVLLTPLVIYGLRERRRRAEGADELAADRARARDDLIAVGEILRELDVDPDMPGIDTEGREALAQAIELYGRADRELAKATTRRRLDRARVTLNSARSQADVAHRRLTAAPSPTGLPE
ncbi:MAG TPA: hypothetical protein VGW10_12730 [Solirubrobacteraceae bacterium]|nr:hypothetical protein [Solirubrobacteraceae bacterium]